MIDKGRALHRVCGAAVAALFPRRRHHRHGRPVAACRPAGDPSPVADDRAPASGGAAADPWDREAGTYVDAATITRLRDEARRTRDEVEQLLSDVGYGARSSCPPDVDAHRDLDHTTDVDIETLMRIDDLHADRRSPTSERSRQRAERVLNEIMHRVIDGYQIEDKPQSRVVQAGRGMEARVTRAYLRVSLLGRRTAWAERWRAGARVALIGLALAAAGTLAAGHLVAAALIVAARVVVSAASTPPPPTATSHRWMSYNPDWLGGAVLNVGDAVILIGIGAHLQVGGRTAWAALTGAAAVFGLSAAYLRVAAHQEGVRLPRLWTDRLIKDVTLTSAVLLGAAMHAPELGTVPALAIAPVAVALLGAVEVARVTYYVRRHHRRVRRAARVDGTLVADAVAFKTDGDLVYHIPLSGRRRPVLDGVDAVPAGAPHGGRPTGGPPDLGAVRATG